MSPERVLVCGGRDYDDWVTFSDVMATIDIAVMCHGCARGADSFAAQYGDMEGIPTEGFRADWRKHGKAAGVMRNQLMLDVFKPTLVVAFPGGRGTADMVSRATKAGVKILMAGGTE